MDSRRGLPSPHGGDPRRTCEPSWPPSRPRARGRAEGRDRRAARAARGTRPSLGSTSATSRPIAPAMSQPPSTISAARLPSPLRRFARRTGRCPRQGTTQVGNGTTCGFVASTDPRGVDRARVSASCLKVPVDLAGCVVAALSGQSGHWSARSFASGPDNACSTAQSRHWPVRGRRLAIGRLTDRHPDVGALRRAHAALPLGTPCWWI